MKSTRRGPNQNWVCPGEGNQRILGHPRSDEPASASSNERRSQFLGRLAWSIREKSAKVVSLGDIAQTLIDAVQQSGIDLSPADSLDQLKQLLVQRLKRPSA